MMIRNAYPLVCLMLAGCAPRQGSPTAGPYAPAIYNPPAAQWRPAPDSVYEAYRPPPPRIPPNLVPQHVTSGVSVRQGFMAPGTCLPGFSRSPAGFCTLGAMPLADLSALLFPWIQGPPLQAPGDKPRVGVTHATVLVESALLNTTKHDGRCWDPGCDEQKSQQASKAAAVAARAALGAQVNPYMAAFAVLAPMAAKVWSHPDATGSAYILTNSTFSEPATLKVRQDTITPQWGLRFDHVPIANGTSLRLELVDADPDIPFTNGDDDMGIINIGVDQLVKAIEKRETLQVEVAGQTHDQVLFVGISVLPEGL